MLKLEEKEYDLNILCNFTFDFQMLKEILLKLATSNKKLEKKVKNLEKSNKEKDKRLVTLEDRLNILFVPDENTYSDSEGGGGEEKKEEKREEKKKENKEEKKEEEVKPIVKKETIKEKEKEKNDEDEDKEKESKQKIKLEKRKTLRDYENKNPYGQQGSQVSHETIKSLLKLIRENTEKIVKIEKNINKKISRSINELENAYEKLSNENTKDHEVINERVRVLNDKIYDYNDRLDDLTVKIAPIDTLSIFKDSGGGSVDTTKAMIKFLEEKLNKRISILEKKTEKENKDDDGFKNKIEEIKEEINKIKNELSNKDNNNNDELDKLVNDYTEEIQEIKNSIENKYNDLLRIIDDVSSRMPNNDILNEQINDILERMKYQPSIKSKKSVQSAKLESKNQQNKMQEEEENNEDINNNYNNNYSSDVKERIKAFNNKLNDIDNYYKSLFNKNDLDLAELKRKIDEINIILEKKITKNDLKPLENKTTEHSDELAFLQDKASELIERISKLTENNSCSVKRLEMLTNDVMLLKDREIPEVESNSIDMSKYVEEKNLNEILKPITKSLENLYLEKEALSKSIKETNDNFVIYETKERVMKLEEDINERLSDYVNDINKKFVEKLEFNKYIKNTEAKLKLLDKEQAKENDNWILAKQPVGCFNCASCESNLKNLSPSSDYISWKNYPKGERQYHMGQGFSKLLQKINEQQKNNYERTNLPSDPELSSSMYFNNMPNVKGNNSHFLFKPKEPSKENINAYTFRFYKKYKLPNVTNNRKKLDVIPLTDEENENEKELNNKSMDNKSNSNEPQIMKIAKKKITGDLLAYKIKQKQSKENKSEIMNSTSLKSVTKLERNQSLPFFDNI